MKVSPAFRSGWRIGQQVHFIRTTIMVDSTSHIAITGFPLTLRYYFIRIQVLLARIGRLARDLSPANNFLVDYFLNDCWPNYSLDQILAGVCTSLEGAERDAHIFERFKGYVDEEEAKIKRKLESVKYCVDAQDTLQLVIGSSRLEKVNITFFYAAISYLIAYIQNLLPLIYLLLRRVWHVLRHARSNALHPKEITNIVDSLGTVFDAACTRAEQLTGMFPSSLDRVIEADVCHMC